MKFRKLMAVALVAAMADRIIRIEDGKIVKGGE